MVFHIGQRLSLKGQVCTVRYVGTVADKPGDFLGVEWDDAARGKHAGSHNGTRYFECRNPSPTAASFLKPSQAWDAPRTFLQALREKYMPEDAGTGADTVNFSSKKAEEVGFDKFARRQAQLQGIHTVVLDHMRIRPSNDPDEMEAIKQICGHVTDLDLCGNLFESLQEILELVVLLPKLAVLTLDSNRFRVNTESQPPPSPQLPILRTLSLSDMYLTWSEIAEALKSFPNVVNLSASHNGLAMLSSEHLPMSLRHLVLSENDFTALSDLQALIATCRVETIALKHCQIREVWSVSPQDQTAPIHKNVHTLDLRNNDIAAWSFYNALSDAYPALRHFLSSGNPLYKDPRSSEGKTLTLEDGHMLTIARLPQLETLNYSKISDKERLNAETFYLGQIAAELSQVPVHKRTDFLQDHPRWEALCEEYGEPTPKQQAQKTELNPNTLAARLVAFTFELAPETSPDVTPRSWTEEVPKSLNIYALLGIVGKKLGVAPLTLQLMWQTDERDPSGQNGAYTEPEWWDSSDEDDGSTTANSQDFVSREVVLSAGTRAVGTYVERSEARVRVEVNK